MEAWPVTGEYNCQAIIFLLLINKNKMEQLDERALQLIKFEPQEILFQHKETRLVYRYYNLSRTDLHPRLVLPDSPLLRGTAFNGGVLYPKEDSNLQLEIEQRRRSFRKDYFSEEEIGNTFLPLFRCLHLLHQEGVTHRAISLQNIVIVDGEVRLRDWLASIPGRGAGEQKNEGGKQQDILSLGDCMLNCTFLTIGNCNQAEWEQRLLSVIQKFSKNFIIVLLVFARRLRSHYLHAVSILEGECKHIDSQLSDIYEALRPQESKPAIKNSPEIRDSKTFVALSPAKKAGTGHKKAAHHENIQNKAEGEGRKVERGRNSDKNISSVHELLGKRLNEQERRLKEETLKCKEKTITNLSNFGVQNNSKKVGFKDHNSPLHKLRPYSRRK